MNNYKNDVSDIVFNIVQEFGDDLNNEALKNPGNQTILFGADGNLDSISLVSLISDIEYRISDTLDKQIILADERAMSQRNSPFRTVETLINYIHQLLNEEV